MPGSSLAADLLALTGVAAMVAGLRSTVSALDIRLRSERRRARGAGPSDGSSP